MTTFDLKDIERLATTLDAVNLDDEDRATLHAVFALAGRAAGEKDEVSGFSIVYQMPGGGDTSGPYPGLRPAGMGDGSVFQSFQWGASSPGGFDIF
jgi:hypothetical protein